MNRRARIENRCRVLASRRAWCAGVRDRLWDAKLSALLEPDEWVTSPPRRGERLETEDPREGDTTGRNEPYAVDEPALISAHLRGATVLASQEQEAA